MADSRKRQDMENQRTAVAVVAKQSKGKKSAWVWDR